MYVVFVLLLLDTPRSIGYCLIEQICQGEMCQVSWLVLTFEYWISRYIMTYHTS